MKALLTAMWAFAASLNPVFAAMSLGAVSLIAVFNWVNTQWAQLILKVDALAAGSFAGTLNVSPLGLMNHLFPLQETFTFFSAWIVVLGACTTIRIIKGFVPTIAT